MTCSPPIGPPPAQVYINAPNGGNGFLFVGNGTPATTVGTPGAGTSPGGKAVSYGGWGGNGTGPFVKGGRGGNAKATGGNGSPNAPGGDATAIGGKGGSGGSAANGGRGGDGESITGNGGPGVTCCTPPSKGHDGGQRGGFLTGAGVGGMGGNAIRHPIGDIAPGVGGIGGNSVVDPGRNADGGDGIPPGKGAKGPVAGDAQFAAAVGGFGGGGLGAIAAPGKFVASWTGGVQYYYPRPAILRPAQSASGTVTNLGDPNGADGYLCPKSRQRKRRY